MCTFRHSTFFLRINLSSTKVKDRIGKHLDFYETPVIALDGLASTGFFNQCGKKFLEPSAGKGAIVKYVKKYVSDIAAYEIQEQFTPELNSLNVNVLIGDFLQSQPVEYDIIVSNPPYSQVLEFINHCRLCLSDQGKMAFLLRLPFVASVKRYYFFADYRPVEINVLSQRPKFGGDNIDSCDYAWFEWRKESAKETKFNWISPL